MEADVSDALLLIHQVSDADEKGSDPLCPIILQEQKTDEDVSGKKEYQETMAAGREKKADRGCPFSVPIVCAI